MDAEDLLVDWQRRTQQQAETSLELSRRMQQVSAAAESPDGEATVTVDHSGGLSALVLTDRAMRLSPEALAALILATSRRAQARMAEEMTRMVAGVYGSDSATTSFVASAYAEQFPAVEDEDDTEERGRR